MGMLINHYYVEQLTYCTIVEYIHYELLLCLLCLLIITIDFRMGEITPKADVFSLQHSVICTPDLPTKILPTKIIP